MGESASLILEIDTIMQTKIDQMELNNKDIILTIGPSRVGKGTLCSALKGIEMKRASKIEIEKQLNIDKSEIAAA